jgi:putative acetyltransferase
MMARAHPAFALRPFLAPDTPLLAEIFRASVEELTSEEYSEAQQEAWAAAADNEEVFGAHLANCLTLVATLEGSVVGFAALEDGDHVAMLYVHPAVARRGVATMLCDALEKLSAARGTAKLTTDASETARRFFERRGYTSQRRNAVPCGGEWLVNTTMEKQLTAQESAP